MATKAIDLGAVSAYAVAVKNGFVGTEAEWEQYIANASINASQAASASEAAAAAQAAAEASEARIAPAVAAGIQAVADQQGTSVADVQAEGATQVQAVRDAGAEQDAGLVAEGQNQIQAIQLAAETQEAESVAAVQAQETASVAAVTQAGTTQTAAVNQAGATQVSAVETKGAETIASIPEDYTELTDEVSDLESAFKKSTGNEMVSGWKIGYYASGSSVTSIDPEVIHTGPEWRCVYLDCQEGDVFYYTGYGSAAARPWVFLLSDGTIQNRGSAETYTDQKVIVPANVAHIVFNAASGNNAVYNVFSGQPLKEKVTENAAEIGDLKSASDKNLTTTARNIIGTSIMQFEDGYIDIPAVGSVVTLTRVTSVMASGYLECNAGDTITINVDGRGSSTGGARAWAFLDSENKVITRANPTATVSGTLIAPENAKMIVVNTHIADKPDSYCYVGVLIKDAVSDNTEKIEQIRAQTDLITPLSIAVNPVVLYWEKGAINVSNGNIASSNTRIISTELPDSILTLSTTDGYDMMIAVWNESDVYVGIVRDSNGNNISKNVAWLSEVNMSRVRTNRNGYKYRAVLRKENDGAIDITESENFLYVPSSSLQQSILVNDNRISTLENIANGTTSNVWALPEFENVVATWKNVVVKCEDINGVNYLRFSNDLGESFTNIENIYGDIVHTHFFLDGSILICFPTRCIVVSNDFTTVTNSVIYDYDGSVFVPTARHFYSYDYNIPHIIDGVEVYAWGDYVVDSTPSRIWYTVDGGHTIKCAFKFGTSTIGGQVISIRHVHGVYYNKYNKHWYVATGDTDSQCYIIQGDYSVTADSWTFAIIAQGSEFKLTGWFFDEFYAYMCTDYTTDSEFWENKGILRAPINQLGDYSKYAFVYKAPQSEFGEVALSKLVIDPNGHKFAFPDYKGNGVFWYADHGWNFKKCTFNNAQLWLTSMTFGPNYNGDMYIVTHNSSSATDQNVLKYNRNVINITKMARENGVPDFYKNTFNSEMITR